MKLKYFGFIVMDGFLEVIEIIVNGGRISIEERKWILIVDEIFVKFICLRRVSYMLGFFLVLGSVVR